MTPQRLDAGPRGAAGLEAMAALSTGGKQKISFFKGDDAGTHIGSHTVHDFSGAAQSVGVVQTWNQCHEMLLTSDDNPNSIIVMDTEVGATKAELTMRRQQKNWKLQVDSILPQQKFEQYKSTKEFSLYGLGDGGKTVFFLNHDSRAGENVEEFVVRADSHKMYKGKFSFTCHAQTRGGYLVLGRTDGAVALYEVIMKDDTASCVIDGMPGPVTSIDVSADGSVIVWATPEFVFFTMPAEGNWAKERIGHQTPKPPVLRLDVRAGELASSSSSDGAAKWKGVHFDAGTARDEVGLREREIVTYSGSKQVRWNVRGAAAAWAALGASDDAPATFYGVTQSVGGAVASHTTVKDDISVVQLADEVVQSLRF